MNSGSNVGAGKPLVNPVALKSCFAEYGEDLLPLADISFLRLNVNLDSEKKIAFPESKFAIRLHLERHQLLTEVQLSSVSSGRARFTFTRLVPSAGAHLRAFLSPKRVGESVVEDWASDSIHHYHGLNESELWFDSEGQILFSYLDNVDYRFQFVLRLPEAKGALQIGRMARDRYIEMESWGSELLLEPLNDRDVFQKLSECRDIATNFRPTGQADYHLKQRLLKVISEALYSTGRKVAMAPPRPVRPRSSSSAEIIN
jgi:hypothetical protein